MATSTSVSLTITPMIYHTTPPYISTIKPSNILITRRPDSADAGDVYKSSLIFYVNRNAMALKIVGIFIYNFHFYIYLCLLDS